MRSLSMSLTFKRPSRSAPGRWNRAAWMRERRAIVNVRCAALAVFFDAFDVNNDAGFELFPRLGQCGRIVGPQLLLQQVHCKYVELLIAHFARVEVPL